MKQQSHPSCKTLLRDERGAVAIIMTVMLPVIIGFMTLAADAGYAYTTHNQLQVAADAAALAGVQYVGFYTLSSSTPCASNPSQPSSGSSLCNAATTLATDNRPIGAGTILPTGASACPGATSCINVGVWSNGTFAPYSSALQTTTAPNAVQVTTQMTAANGNALNLFFTSMLGIIAKTAGFQSINLSATAIAAYSGTNAAGGGSLVTPVTRLIVVSDISSSFSSDIANAIAAAKDCADYGALTGGVNTQVGVTLFTGNSPQVGWAPQGWTSSTKYTTPYFPLTSVTSSNFQSTADTQINAIKDCNSNSDPYTCSGTNIAAGMQAAINQFCPLVNSCGTTVNNGTMEMIIITDGVSNCTYEPSSPPYGTSTIAGQNCPAGQVNNGHGQGETNAQTAAGDVQLLADAQTLATTAGNYGITVSTLYYSGENGQGNGNTVDPNSSTHQTYAQELQSLTTLANTALAEYHPGSLTGLFFNQPTSSLLKTDMRQTCAYGIPRLVQ